MPLPFWMTPPNAVEPPLPPVVSVAAPAALLVTLPPAAPPPARLPIVSLAARSSATPAVLASTTAPVSAMALPPDTASVPAFTVVLPV